MKTALALCVLAAVSAGAMFAAAPRYQPAGARYGARHHDRERAVEEHMAMVNDLSAINILLDDFHDAASKADFDRYFGHQTPDAVFLGTDGTERWEGQAFRDFCRPYFEKGTGWTYRPRNRHVRVADAGGIAWFDEMLDNESYGSCRGSGVVVRGQDGVWRLAQYNLSIPIPNDLATPVVKMIREHAAAQPPTR